MLVQGEGTGGMIEEAHDNGGQRVVDIVHRAVFLLELMANVPQDRMHASKKLDHYVQTNKSLLWLTSWRQAKIFIPGLTGKVKRHCHH